ncbi:MAG: hypothetical protein GX165_08255 [Firmicutes bacterium]|nr:hypothetical protein [Bacillota bacterium]
MRAKKSLLICLLVISWHLLPLSGALASEVAIAWRAFTPPVIDGDLSDWDKVDPVYLGKAEQLNANPEYWSGPEDNSGIFYLAWDPENLYIAAEISDDSPFIWFMAYDVDGNDGLAVYLSTNPEAERGRRIYDSADFRLLFGLDNDMFGTGIDRTNVLLKKGINTAGLSGHEKVIKNCEVAIQQTQGGYNLEIKIPFASLSNDQIPPLKPEPGTEVGFNLELYDLDQSCPGAVTSVLVWKPGNPKMSPQHWGILRFQER